MAENPLSGPQVGQTVYWWTGSAILMGWITAVSGGVASVTTLNGSTLTANANAPFDPFQKIAGSWSYPPAVTGI
jgi:hypothetical protein